MKVYVDVPARVTYCDYCGSLVEEAELVEPSLLLGRFVYLELGAMADALAHQCATEAEARGRRREYWRGLLYPRRFCPLPLQRPPSALVGSPSNERTGVPVDVDDLAYTVATEVGDDWYAEQTALYRATPAHWPERRYLEGFRA